MNSEEKTPSIEEPHLQAADGGTFRLKPGETVIGRDPSCEIRLYDSSVSKRHCAITFSEGSASVTDLGSTNHTFVNQCCLREGQSSPLLHGDRLILGRSILTYLDPHRPSPPSRRPDAIESPASGADASESTIVSFELDTLSHEGGKQPFSEAAFRELRKANERLSIFYDFGTDVSNILDMEQLLRNVARRIMKLIPADSGVILLKRLREYQPFLCWSGEGFQDLRCATFSRTALTRAIREKRGLFVRDTASQPQLSEAESIRGLRIQSTMIVPIVLKNEVFGALSLSACGRQAEFGPDDFAMVSGIASQIAVALKNAHLAEGMKRATEEKVRLERELEIAAEVQKSILPTSPPSLPGLEIGGVSFPAREVGGDFYDYILREGNILGATIADVSGKGLAAALLTLQSRNILHALARESRSPADVLQKANYVVYDDYSRADMFLSAFYAVIDPARGTLQYASAGHSPPLLIREDGSRLSLRSTGSLLGISPDLSITEHSVDLADNDLLALYTDGVSDARDSEGNPFGLRKLAERLGEFRNLPAHEIAFRIVGEVTSLAGPARFDDATLVVIKVQEG
jgi:serine phosphatase RsbU (regulator of sigma subunit)